MLHSAAPVASALSGNAASSYEQYSDLAEEEQPGDLGPVVLITTIDISPGVAEAVELRKNDDPVVVARRFCELHNMPEQICEPLAKHLTEHYEKALVKVCSPPVRLQGV